MLRCIPPALVALCGPAMAQTADFDSMTLARELGTIIAAEQPCGLAFDQAAIAAFIAERVDPADTSFAPALQMMIGGAAYELEESSESAMTAHCAAVSQSARHYGLIK